MLLRNSTAADWSLKANFDFSLLWRHFGSWNLKLELLAEVPKDGRAIALMQEEVSIIV